MTRRKSVRDRLRDMVVGLLLATLGFGIGWGLLRLEPSTPVECVLVVIAGHHIVGAGRDRHDAFVVITDTGAAAQVWSEPVRPPFDSAYRGAALLAVRHGAWFGDHTALGRRCVASGATAPVAHDPHRSSGYVPTDLAGAAGWRLYLLTGVVELVLIFEGWRLRVRWRRTRRGRAHAHKHRDGLSSGTHNSTTQLPHAGSSA